MRKIWFLSFVLVTQCLVAQEKKDTPYVILVSFDGFRYDYVTRFDPPHFRKFIKTGAAAKGLIPSFPSKTFPNHYTLVTGLAPGHHGLVDNNFFDPTQNKLYEMRNRDMVTDSTFYGGTPLWQLAQQQGIHAASFFWVGSEVAVKGTHPDYYFKYDVNVPDKDRVDQTIAWLKLPVSERPHFISLYFSFTDTEAHNTGLHSEELKKAVFHADSLLGVLTSRVNKLKLPVNIIVVSDHGMMELKQQEDSYINLGKLFNLADTSLIYINGGTQTHFYTSKVDSLYNVLKAQEKHFKVYKQSMYPTQWQYKNPRSGDILLVADPGYYIQQTSHSWEKSAHRNVFGAHGYDPYLVKDMQGIFYAQGPNIKKRMTIEPFSNVHVYPLIAKILGLKAPVVDGKVEVLEGILK
jgi:predicted AlkP superfamily pyrophosphatase or phosphodiesterase